MTSKRIRVAGFVETSTNSTVTLCDNFKSKTNLYETLANDVFAIKKT